MERAWYDRGSGFLRDCIVLLHAPYTLWHLAYVVIGATLATTVDWGLLGWTLLSFFLAMGIGAHCLDEMKGRPMQTGIPIWLLGFVAGLSIAWAVIIGLLVGVEETAWVIPCIVFGGFIVFAYNLEMFGGFFHHDIWFGVAWGAFPIITSYVAQEHGISWTAALMALFCLIYSGAQRTLSKQVRHFRRRVHGLSGNYFEEVSNSPLQPVRGRIMDKGTIIGAPELALKMMTWAVVIAAIALVIQKV